MILPLSQLTQSGVKAFEKLLADAPSLSARDVQQEIEHIVRDASMSKVVSPSIQVPIMPSCATRADVAHLVTQLMAKLGRGFAPGDEPMHSWLALAWLPALCKTKGGRIMPGEMARYLLSSHSSDFWRHLVACPFWLMQRHGAKARIFLCQAAYTMPDVVEQVASRPWLIESSGVVEVIDRLYWNEVESRPKDGFTATRRIADPPPGMGKAVPEPGTLRALDMVLAQVQCNFDLRSMSADQIIEKLPSEFTPWLRLPSS